MAEQEPALIGIDWGTSNLRIHLIDSAGSVIKSRRSAMGILKVEADQFGQTLDDEIGDWLKEFIDVPVLACGMVGSRQGWLEVPYVACPAGVDELAASLSVLSLDKHDARVINFVAGVAWHGEQGQNDVADVIRGEETIIAGSALRDGLICLPGTHAKWAWVRDGSLREFRTAMSGEVYQVLLEHSILGRMADQTSAFDHGAFVRGVARAGSAGGLLHHLFSVRSLRLFDELSQAQAASYLSGLLTAHDVIAMQSNEDFVGEVNLLGEGAAFDAYAHAFTTLGIAYTRIDGDVAVAAGLYAIAAAAGLLPRKNS